MIDSMSQDKAGPTAFTSIPTIDLSDFRRIASRTDVARQVDRACSEVGFFYLTGHNISPDLLGRTWQQARKFFCLPMKEKSKLHLSLSSAQRGYFGPFDEAPDTIGTDGPVANEEGDFKEGFDLSRDLACDHPDVLAGKAFYGPNVYPRSLPAFKEVVDEYYDAIWRVGRNLLRLFEMALELPSNYFDDKVDHPMAQLRLLRYPALGASYASTAYLKGAGEHTDYGCITLLAIDEVGGLQVRNSVGDWIDVPSKQGALVVNIGEIMQRWTDDRYVATVHRVSRTPGQTDRYSIPFFFDPNYDAVIECVPSCMPMSGTPKYSPIKAGDYLTMRFATAFKHRQPTPQGGQA
jgi:isopenicillin N synthase-like dioxygenase